MLYLQLHPQSDAAHQGFQSGFNSSTAHARFPVAALPHWGLDKRLNGGGHPQLLGTILPGCSFSFTTSPGFVLARQPTPDPDITIDFNLHPAGTFLRGVLDKVGVQPELVRIGKFKSAGDQLLRSDMSVRRLPVLLPGSEDSTLARCPGLGPGDSEVLTLKLGLEHPHPDNNQGLGRCQGSGP